mmetsp:Transcript_9903/g.26131  ORF Transcript_9903/g.26131 Transcript_9903/m.26131 type:complete len:342 (+) Transcript_9903:97-1122(+)
MPLSVHGFANGNQGLDLLYHPVNGALEPFPKHEDSMHLNVIRPKDVPRCKPIFEKDDAQALRTHDIKGAQSRLPHSDLFPNGPAQKDDIPGSRPRTFYPDVNRMTDYSLHTGDIERAQPAFAKFKTSRVVDPLTPRYELPSVRMVPAEEPPQRFHEGEARDTLSIKGEWKPRIFERNYARNPNENRDIEHASASYGTMQRTAGLGFTPRDPNRTIEQVGSRILSSKVTTDRMTCPLDPVYTNSTRTMHPFHEAEAEGSGVALRRIGPVEGATPRVLHRDNGEPQASLIRRDIGGAVPQRYKGGTPFSIFDPPSVTPFATGLGLDCSDIPGAQPGTRKPGTL